MWDHKVSIMDGTQSASDGKQIARHEFPTSVYDSIASPVFCSK